MADFVPAFSARGVDPVRAVPGTAIAMAVTSVFLLALTSGSVVPPLLATAVLVATPLLYWHPALAPLARWLVRAGIFFAVLGKMLYSGFRFDQDWLLNPMLLSSIGFFLSGEIAFQASRPRREGQASVPPLILLSALILICASFTRDIRFVPFVTPLYFVFLLLTLHRFSPESRVKIGAVVRPLRAQLLAFGIAVLFAGMILHCTLWFNRDAITRAFMSVMLRFEQQASTGLPDAPYLRNTSELAQSRSRLLRVSGELRDPHLRSASFDFYAPPGTWRPMIATRWFNTIALPDLNPNHPGPRLRIERIKDTSGTLYAPLHAAGVVTDEPVQLEFTRWFDNGPLRAVNPGSNRVNYEVILDGNALHQWMFCRPDLLSPDVRKKFDFDLHGSRYEVLTRVPEFVDRRVVDLGKRITVGLATPREKIAAVTKYLEENHHYSLRVNLSEGDPISKFLLEKKDGFCEYFASAAVMLLRAGGIPARYAQGYYVHDRREDGSYIVRARDAHAWCEAWVEGTGWVTVEATPPAALPSMTDDPALHERFGEWLSDLWESFVQWFTGNGWRAIFFAALLLLALLGLLRIVQAWRRRARGAGWLAFSYAAPGEALRGFHARFEALLNARRAHCPPDRTWQEHLELLARRTEYAAGTEPKLDLEKAREFVRGYNAARFRTAPAFEELKRLNELLARLERS